MSNEDTVLEDYIDEDTDDYYIDNAPEFKAPAGKDAAFQRDPMNEDTVLYDSEDDYYQGAAFAKDPMNEDTVLYDSEDEVQDSITDFNYGYSQPQGSADSMLIDPMDEDTMLDDPADEDTILDDPLFDDYDATVLDSEPEFVKFRLASASHLPREIVISKNLTNAFTIGRFDTSIGKKQSDFEFDKKTRAVSRRHATIEHFGKDYFITDLSSSAGTYVNGKRIQSNKPIRLSFGDRVSFGNAGADYVFES
ncbi:MAG: FHA domain-containing protein [Clostridiales bacterium]|nr:FHA domain-containing protein [Clostridiales bacterium]